MHITSRFRLIIIFVTLFGLPFDFLAAGTAQAQGGFSLWLPGAFNEPPVPFATVAVGDHYTCAVREGALKCWGINGDGQLGDGTITDRLVPVDVIGLGSGVVAVDVDSFHTCALLDGGAVKCWGYNAFGELGNPVDSESDEPVDVTGMASGATSIAVAEFHTCAIHEGSVKCWGYNGDGRVGVAPGEHHFAPINVPGLETGVTHLSAGRDFTCVVQNGGVKCWGKNTYGQLGVGTTGASHIPAFVNGLASGVTTVETGEWHACALLDTDAVKCWGWNEYGQLGNNAFGIDSSLPVDVADLGSGVKALSAGDGHTCAITASGPECWGWNSYYQLADNTKFSRPAPVDAKLFSNNVIAVIAGGFHTCAVDLTSIKCLGYNRNGGLGDGTTTNRTVPTNVLWD